MAVRADRVVVELEAQLDRYDQRVREAERRFVRGIDVADKSGSIGEWLAKWVKRRGN